MILEKMSVDDDNGITTTFKAAIEDSNNVKDPKKRIEVYR